VRALLQLRQRTPALRRGRTANLLAADKQWVYVRAVQGSVALVAINMGDGPANLDVAAAPAGLADGTTLAERLGTGATARVEDGRVRISLPAGSSGVFVP